MSRNERRKEKEAEWEAIRDAEHDEECRVAGLCMAWLIDEAALDDKMKRIVERICEHIGLDMYADPKP